MIITKNQERSKRNKERLRIRKSRCIESDRTHCCIQKFNMALSLCKVLEVALYFSKGFSGVAIGKLAAIEALQPLEVTVICFLGQKFNLQSLILQQRHRLFLRYFLYLSLVNLLLLANLEKRSTYGELDCFLGAGKNMLEGNGLVNKATRDIFVLLQKAMILPSKKALPYF